MTTIVYIPGLGGERTLQLQRTVVGRWNNAEIRTVFFEPMWHSAELTASKLDRLKTTVTNIKTGAIHCIGVSAGGSLGIIAHDLMPDSSRLTLVAAKFTNPESISGKYHTSAPALHELVVLSTLQTNKLNARQRSTIISYRPLYDEVIPVKEMIIDGAVNKCIMSVGHALSIAIALTLLIRPATRH